MEETKRQSKEQKLPWRSPTTVNDISDHLLRLIFSRLDSHVAYVRAAAVCSRWRRLASTGGIRNLDSINHHDFSTTIGHHHVVDPSFSAGPRRSSREQPHRRVVFVPASASIYARHFTLDFLPSCPGGRRWELVDGCGSLLLLVSQRRHGMFPDLVVCEPISRRYVRVQPVVDMKRSHCLGVFLGHGYYNSVRSMCDFSLTCVLCEPSAGIADGVSTVTARVYRHRPSGWSWWNWKYGWTMPGLASSGSIHLRGSESAHYVGRSNGFIFWGIERDGTAFAAREDRCELSHFCLPEHVRGSPHHRSTFRFIDDGRTINDNLVWVDNVVRVINVVRVVSLVGDELTVFVKREDDDNGGGGDWVPEKSLNLREATCGLPGYKECFFGHTAKIVTAGKGYVACSPQRRRLGCSLSSSEPCGQSVSTAGIGSPVRCIRTN